MVFRQVLRKSVNGRKWTDRLNANANANQLIFKQSNILCAVMQLWHYCCKHAVSEEDKEAVHLQRMQQDESVAADCQGNRTVA